METIILKTIDEEAADCRAAFANSKVGDLVNFCHHEEPVEALVQPAEDRIAYILTEKPLWEQALRLRLFRPIKDAGQIEWQLADALTALAKSQARFNKEQKQGGPWELQDMATGLYRATKVVVEKIMKTYPFESQFGVEWDGDIFSTFPHENAAENRILNSKTYEYGAL